MQNEIRLSATGTSNCNAKYIGGGGGGGSVAEARASRSTSDAVDRKEDQAEDGSSSEKSMDLSSPRRRIQDLAPPSCQEQTEETIAHGAIDDENTAKEAVAVHEQNGVAMNDDLQQHNSAAPATDGARSKENLGTMSSPSSSPSSSSSTSGTKTPTFQALLTLCVSDTRLSSWSDLEALHGFPKLKSLKIRVIEYFCDDFFFMIMD